ncbi:MAG: AMP-binding protein [Actinomycetia bacterium]|nr:AMP-binding protein [Actinomycetes bacterium]
MDTIPHLVLANAQHMPDAPALLRRHGDGWVTTTWAEYGLAVRRAAAALIASGVEQGDRVAILSYNTPEWVIFDVAAMAVGAVPVGIYYASSPHEVADLLERSGATVLLAQTAGHVAMVDQDAHRALRMIVGIDTDDGGAIGWGEFLARGDETDGVVDERIAAIRPEHDGTIIFTAAGFGEPAGVVLTHANLVFAGHSSVELFDVTADDSALSYLPLSHIAEQIFTILAPAHVGYPVAFAQSLGRVRNDLPDIQPSIFFGVPLVWAGFERGIRKQIDSLVGLERRVARWAMRANRADIASRNAGSKRSLYGRAAAALARRMFSDRVKAIMGFSNSRLAFCGAVSADPDMLAYFSGIDIVIREVYGLSEATGPSVVTREGATRFGTVGQPMPGVEISLADDDEILIRGASVFDRYLDDEFVTRRALRDGWLHTGDIGRIDEDGFLTISGRKKDIVITSGGKNVDPGAIEPLLEADPFINDAIVVGDGYDQLGVLMSVAEDAEDAEDADAAGALERARAIVKKVNQRFARAEQIRRVGLLSRSLSIEHGERNADGRLERRLVVEHFADEIAALYR